MHFTLFTGKTVGGKLDGETVEAGPVRHVLQHVGLLARVGLGAAVVDGLVDGVEYAADQDGLPDDLRASFRGQRLDRVEGEIRPRAGAIEVEVELPRHFVPRYPFALSLP